MPIPSATVDVAVIGAGYAGLSTALSLSDSGLDVLVLEASGRVGGRAWSWHEDGPVVDRGGQWVGPTQSALLGWADRFGCATFPTYDEGAHLECWPGAAPVQYRSGTPAPGRGAGEYAGALADLDRMAARIPVDEPTRCDSLAEWDSLTVAEWMRRNLPSPAARARMRVAVQGVWACEPRDLSLFHLLFYVAAAGGFEQLMGTRGCAQDRRFLYGADAPARAAAAELGSRVRLRSPVRTVRWHARGVELDTPAGTVAARRLVTTGTPPAQARIGFEPPLPMPRRRWLGRSPMGDVAKVHLTFAEPFWRARGLSGQLVDYGDGPVAYTFDNSPADASRGVLVGFVYADHYRRWRTLDASRRHHEVLASLAPLGLAERELLAYDEALWPDLPWAEGAYGAVPSPGTWTAYGEDGWRRPVGPIHWAGTETAGPWHGYIDGAIRSGERAAREVVAALGSRRASNDGLPSTVV
ncbi:monoamine oxidase [Nocardioides thalensis]|uniref:Monoamine oxidase n=1 Tax=Nocardioides thalensis TaxID=1914755 RepID=A0A853C3C7_9ACTN|nr:monoamine oxidase [Nocardioides thalensis]